MRKAKRQAEDYARALPKEHGWPPFLLVVDVGYVFEVYADFSGQGKNYAQFPDRAGYSIPLAGLRDPEIRARLRAVWTEPQSLDPAKRSAEVTRDIAERLAKIARNLEGKRDPKEVAEFLMRCLFTMFAEDVGLLPERSFEDLLSRMVETPQNFAQALESLWRVMDEGGYAPHLNATLKRFNGALFRNRTAIALDKDDIRELWIAATRDWRDVEPAIFGTLLERALDERERAKLGAHYTPRAYVERLVVPTIIEPLRADWEEALARAHEQEAAGDRDGALRTVKDFHHTLCTTRVLDPACGTGNFLYVALETMKRLEGEVMEALVDLGEVEPRLAMKGETVDPSQFYGLELNPRAVAIADLVLWLGYLKWQLRTVKAKDIAEPVLEACDNIREQDAILAWDRQELLRDDSGRPLSRWDGFTMKLHPVTGEEVPDTASKVAMHRYENPRRAEWPEADFVVGNPPFIGKGEDMRTNLGDGYVDAIRKAHSDVPGSADYVLYWWNRCASLLKNKKIIRFGLITTNSISQILNRKVLESYIYSPSPLSIVWCVPDHPWITAAGSAMVRISMTIVEQGEKTGTLYTSIREIRKDGGEYSVKFNSVEGEISPRLRVGVDLSCDTLTANDKLSSMGPALGSRGFVLSSHAKNTFVRQDGESTNRIYRKLLSPKELSDTWKGRYIPDLQGISSETELLQLAPSLYSHLRNSVYEYRKHNKDRKLVKLWWKFRRSNDIWRGFLENTDKAIMTPETSKHRFFVIRPSEYISEHGSITFGLQDLFIHSILSSRIHCLWAYENGGRLGLGPRYNKTVCFDNFPIPNLDKNAKENLGKLSDVLENIRQNIISNTKKFNLNDLCNLIEKERAILHSTDGEKLEGKDREYHNLRMVSEVRSIHDDIDRAAFEAYGWADLIPALVGKPGATAPSPHKTPEQEEAEEDLLSRLVALNRERAEEERRGQVRWLRPDYQIPKLGHKAAAEAVQAEADLAAPAAGKPDWPEDGLDQLRAVADMLRRAAAPQAAESLGKAFKGRNTAKRKRRVAEVLDALAETGPARQAADGRYFIPR